MRQWRVLSLGAPSLNLLPSSGSALSAYHEHPDEAYVPVTYPASVAVERLFSVQDMMSLQRDHFQGTRFDLEQGLASGPYGDPNRYDQAVQPDLTREQLVDGEYER